MTDERKGGVETPEATTNVVDLKEQYEHPKRPWTVRPLRDGDVFKVGAMLPKLMGNPNLQYAAAMGEENQNAFLMGVVAALFETIPRDMQLFCAELIGKSRNYDDFLNKHVARQKAQINANQAWRERRDEARDVQKFLDEDPEPIIENLPPPEVVRQEMEDDILEEMNQLPPGATFEIVAEVMEREDFAPFVSSALRMYEAGKGLSGRYGTLFSNTQESPKPNS